MKNNEEIILDLVKNSLAKNLVPLNVVGVPRAAVAPKTAGGPPPPPAGGPPPPPTGGPPPPLAGGPRPPLAGGPPPPPAGGPRPLSKTGGALPKSGLAANKNNTNTTGIGRKQIKADVVIVDSTKKTMPESIKNHENKKNNIFTNNFEYKDENRFLYTKEIERTDEMPKNEKEMFKICHGKIPTILRVKENSNFTYSVIGKEDNGDLKCSQITDQSIISELKSLLYPTNTLYNVKLHKKLIASNYSSKYRITLPVNDLEFDENKIKNDPYFFPVDLADLNRDQDELNQEFLQKNSDLFQDFYALFFTKGMETDDNKEMLKLINNNATNEKGTLVTETKKKLEKFIASGKSTPTSFERILSEEIMLNLYLFEEKYIEYIKKNNNEDKVKEIVKKRTEKIKEKLELIEKEIKNIQKKGAPDLFKLSSDTRNVFMTFSNLKDSLEEAKKEFSNYEAMEDTNNLRITSEERVKETESEVQKEEKEIETNLHKKINPQVMDNFNNYRIEILHAKYLGIKKFYSELSDYKESLSNKKITKSDVGFAKNKNEKEILLSRVNGGGRISLKCLPSLKGFLANEKQYKEAKKYFENKDLKKIRDDINQINTTFKGNDIQIKIKTNLTKQHQDLAEKLKTQEKLLADYLKHENNENEGNPNDSKITSSINELKQRLKLNNTTDCIRYLRQEIKLKEDSLYVTVEQTMKEKLENSQEINNNLNGLNRKQNEEPEKAFIEAVIRTLDLIKDIYTTDEEKYEAIKKIIYPSFDITHEVGTVTNLKKENRYNPGGSKAREFAHLASENEVNWSKIENYSDDEIFSLLMLYDEKVLGNDSSLKSKEYHVKLFSDDYIKGYCQTVYNDTTSQENAIKQITGMKNDLIKRKIELVLCDLMLDFKEELYSDLKTLKSDILDSVFVKNIKGPSDELNKLKKDFDNCLTKQEIIDTYTSFIDDFKKNKPNDFSVIQKNKEFSFVNSKYPSIFSCNDHTKLSTFLSDDYFKMRRVIGSAMLENVKSDDIKKIHAKIKKKDYSFSDIICKTINCGYSKLSDLLPNGGGDLLSLDTGGTEKEYLFHCYQMMVSEGVIKYGDVAETISGNPKDTLIIRNSNKNSFKKKDSRSDWMNDDFNTKEEMDKAIDAKELKKVSLDGRLNKIKETLESLTQKGEISDVLKIKIQGYIDKEIKEHQNKADFFNYDKVLFCIESLLNNNSEEIEIKKIYQNLVKGLIEDLKSSVEDAVRDNAFTGTQQQDLKDEIKKSENLISEKNHKFDYEKLKEGKKTVEDAEVSFRKVIKNNQLELIKKKKGEVKKELNESFINKKHSDVILKKIKEIKTQVKDEKISHSFFKKQLEILFLELSKAKEYKKHQDKINSIENELSTGNLNISIANKQPLENTFIKTSREKLADFDKKNINEETTIKKLKDDSAVVESAISKLEKAFEQAKDANKFKNKIERLKLEIEGAFDAKDPSNKKNLLQTKEHQDELLELCASAENEFKEYEKVTLGERKKELVEEAIEKIEKELSAKKKILSDTKALVKVNNEEIIKKVMKSIFNRSGRGTVGDGSSGGGDPKKSSPVGQEQSALYSEIKDTIIPKLLAKIEEELDLYKTELMSNQINIGKNNTTLREKQEAIEALDINNKKEKLKETNEKITENLSKIKGKEKEIVDEKQKIVDKEKEIKLLNLTEVTETQGEKNKAAIIYNIDKLIIELTSIDDYKVQLKNRVDNDNYYKPLWASDPKSEIIKECNNLTEIQGLIDKLNQVKKTINDDLTKDNDKLFDQSFNALINGLPTIQNAINEVNKSKKEDLDLDRKMLFSLNHLDTIKNINTIKTTISKNIDSLEQNINNIKNGADQYNKLNNEKEQLDNEMLNLEKEKTDLNKVKTDLEQSKNKLSKEIKDTEEKKDKLDLDVDEVGKEIEKYTKIKDATIKKEKNINEQKKKLENWTETLSKSDEDGLPCFPDKTGNEPDNTKILSIISNSHPTIESLDKDNVISDQSDYMDTLDTYLKEQQKLWADIFNEQYKNIEREVEKINAQEAAKEAEKAEKEAKEKLLKEQLEKKNLEDKNKELEEKVTKEKELTTKVEEIKGACEKFSKKIKEFYSEYEDSNNLEKALPTSEVIKNYTKKIIDFCGKIDAQINSELFKGREQEQATLKDAKTTLAYEQKRIETFTVSIEAFRLLENVRTFRDSKNTDKEKTKEFIAAIEKMAPKLEKTIKNDLDQTLHSQIIKVFEVYKKSLNDVKVIMEDNLVEKKASGILNSYPDSVKDESIKAQSYLEHAKLKVKVGRVNKKKKK